jgi:hypothetical protein
MTTTQRSRLEVEEDRPLQERLWRIQRVAWAAMVLILIAALAGATGGGGPFAHATSASAAGTIDYPRISRWRAADRMVIALAPDATDSVELEIDAAFAETFSIESIEPQPSASRATPTGHAYEFDLSPVPGRKEIVFHLRAGSPALPTRAEARLGDGLPHRLTLTVLP